MNPYVARSGRILGAWTIAFAIVALAIGALSPRLLIHGRALLATQFAGHLYDFGGFTPWNKADNWPFVYAFVIELVLAAGYVATGRAWTRSAFRAMLAMRMSVAFLVMLVAHSPT